MSLVKELREALEGNTEDEIKKAINERLAAVGFDGIGVSEVAVESNGETVVSFADLEGDEMDVLFSWDDDDGAEAIILNDGFDLEDDEEGDDDLEIDMVDIDPLDPKLIDLGSGEKAVDLVNNGWMNKTFFETLFTAADFMDDILEPESVDERKAVVVRGGKKVKVALVRRKRKKRLTSKQKAGIRKGARKRKAKKGAIARKRKKSLKLRKRLKLKKKDNKRFKVSGGR